MENQNTKQRIYPLDKNIQFSSAFQSGNLANVLQKDSFTFDLYIEPDPKSSYKTWFYFSVSGIPQNTMVTFCIKNMSNQVKLFKQGHLPVFRIQQQPNWSRIKIPLQQNGISRGEQGFELTFKYNFNSKSKHYFAFSYPWTYTENNNFIQSINSLNQDIYLFDSRTLCHSSKHLQLKLLTVTKKDELIKPIVKQIKELPQFHVLTYPQKIGIFITSRVHPGEVASSHILNGFLRYLLSRSQQAQILLQKCIFYIIPMLNPDGVIDGNFRCDSLGRNLNRFYTSPSKEEQPQIYGVKKFVVQMINSKLIHFCLDLHAHVNKQGCFVYGNSTSSLKDQVDVCLFPKLLEYNCRFFDYQSSNFSQKNMSSKDKGDELSKQGASRVSIYKQTGLVNCWTLECNYNSSKLINELPNAIEQQTILKSVSHNILLNNNEPKKREEICYFDLKQFHQIGKDIAVTICDYYRLTKVARYTNTPLKNMTNLKLSLAIQALRMIPFRFDNQSRKLQININSRQLLNQTFTKILQKLKQQSFNQFLSQKQLKQKSKSKDAKLRSLKTIQAKSISIKQKNEKLIHQKIMIIIPKAPKNITNQNNKKE